MQKSQSRFITLFILLPKLLKLTKLVKAAKFLKIAKPLITLITLSISAIVYAFALGSWWFALGLMVMLLIHEFGHVIALNLKGYKPAPMVFIPLLGAAIFVPNMDDRNEEAFIGIGGPVLGTIGALLAFFLWGLLPNKESSFAMILITVSYVGIFLNLFNMIPIRPLDGGRITQTIGPWFKYIGISALAAISILFQEPMILLIWILVLPELTVVSVKVRLLLSVSLWIAMVTMMLMGFSSQPFWVDVLDCILGLMFVVMLYGFFRSGDDPADTDDLRPAVSQSDKMKWLFSYLGLTVLLVGVMMWQLPYLPQPQ